MILSYKSSLLTNKPKMKTTTTATALHTAGTCANVLRMMITLTSVSIKFYVVAVLGLGSSVVLLVRVSAEFKTLELRINREQREALLTLKRTIKSALTSTAAKKRLIGFSTTCFYWL